MMNKRILARLLVLFFLPAAAVFFPAGQAAHAVSGANIVKREVEAPRSAPSSGAVVSPAPDAPAGGKGFSFAYDLPDTGDGGGAPAWLYGLMPGAPRGN